MVVSKLTMIAAGAVGYVLGSRAGRGPYEKLNKQAERVMGDPRVQKRVSQAKGQAKQKAEGRLGDEQESGTGFPGQPSAPTAEQPGTPMEAGTPTATPTGGSGAGSRGSLP